MAQLNCVILAAGKGTRMRSKTPKIAHPIMGRPMVRHVVAAARQLRPDRIIVVTGHEHAMVENCLKGEDVTFCLQTEQRGTAHALLTTESVLTGGDILVLYGDVPLMKPATLESFVCNFRESEGITFMTTEVARPEGYGRVVVDDGDNILDIVEDIDATGPVRDIRLINTGICMIRNDLLGLVKAVTPDNKKGEYYLTDICKVARSRGIKVGAYFHAEAGEVLGINTRRELLDANLLMRNAILDRHMENGVTIGDRTVYIESDVVIGQDTVILPYCYIAGKTEIGEDVTIGPHAVIRNSVIGKGATIEPFSFLDGVVTAERARITSRSRVAPLRASREGE